ncbi:MAG: EutN/CcmL family microcompartment protein [Verrucomicrobiota bacterium]
MRMGTVIGRVTLSVKNEKFFGERLLLTLPWKQETFEGKEVYGPSVVVFDQLGADVGQHIALSEGAEAASPFPKPTPVDAYCAALIDHHFYTQHS